MEKVFLYALLTAMLWGFAPLFGKVGLKMVDPLLALGIRTFFVFLIVSFLVIFTGKAKELFALLPSKGAFYVSCEALFGAILGQLFYFYALKGGEASRVVPIASAFPLFTALFAFLFLGEKFQWPKFLGAVLIVGGMILLRR